MRALLTLCFNPLPARRPGATGFSFRGECLDLVSILSQPEGRELPGTTSRLVQALTVSILSQPEGRELRILIPAASGAFKFQSSPSPKAGSYVMQ